ncbi:MAG: hypothetical protein M3258_04335 [Thermoproteota archaeon]|nr:hypothetical protein [Thermoproteota archaeon]
MNLRRQKENSGLPFQVRAISALAISAIADAMDYIGAPIFALPVIGDITDGVVIAVLYRLTGSKTSTAMNTVELIPFIGDFIPMYTITTLVWIVKESQKRNNRMHQIDTLRTENKSPQVITGNSNDIKSKMILTMNSENENLRTRLMRAYAVLRNKTS